MFLSLCYRCINTHLHTPYELLIYFQRQFVPDLEFLIGYQQGEASGCEINVFVLSCMHAYIRDADMQWHIAYLVINIL